VLVGWNLANSEVQVCFVMMNADLVAVETVSWIQQSLKLALTHQSLPSNIDVLLKH
jgi:hypothetical protein